MSGQRVLSFILLILLHTYICTAQDACYVTKKVCFTVAGLSSTDVNVACPLVGDLKTCLDNAACTINDPIADAIITGGFANLQELCQDNLCLSQYRTCLSIWDRFGKGLLIPEGQGWCTPMSSNTCSPTIAASCELVGLKVLSDLMASLFNKEVSPITFCTNRKSPTCAARALLCYPSTLLNFAPDGQNIIRTCTNETATITCLSDLIDVCLTDVVATHFFPGKIEAIQDHCASVGVTEARKCFSSVSPSVSDPTTAACNDQTIKDCVENALQVPSTSEDQATMQAILSAWIAACEPTQPGPVCMPDLTECFDRFCVFYPHACNFGSSEEGGSSELSGTSEHGSSSEEWIRHKRHARIKKPSRKELRKLRKKKCIAALYPLTCVVDHLTPCPAVDITPKSSTGYKVAKKLAKYYKKHCGDIPGIEILGKNRN